MSAAARRHPLRRGIWSVRSITDLTYEDEDIPPTSELEGIDLVTEGVLTMNRVLAYAQDYLDDNNLYYVWRAKN